MREETPRENKERMNQWAATEEASREGTEGVELSDSPERHGAREDVDFDCMTRLTF